MSRGRRYDENAKLNYSKVFAVIIAALVLVVAIITLKNILTKAKNTKPVEVVDYFVMYEENKWGILGSNGNVVINPMYQEMPIVVDKTKDVFLCTYDINEDEGTYKTKVVNKENLEIWTNYEKIEALENYDKDNNLWYEKNVLKVQKDGKWGLINLDGKEISEIVYDDIKTLKGVENSIIVIKDGNYGLLNSKGVKILDTNYNDILRFGEDYINGYIVINSDNKYELVNNSGEKILQNSYDKIENIYSDKYFVVIEDGKKEVINKSGDKIIVDGFDEINQIANSGVIFVKSSKYGLMNFEGTTIIEPEYDEIKEINTDIFSVKKDGKVGVVDKDKNEKVAISFLDITYNKKAGIYIAEDENYNSSILNSNFEVKLVGILSEMNTENGYMKLKISDDYKYYNFKFEEKKIQDILQNNKIYLSKKDGKYGYVDNKGNVIVEYIYDDAQELNKYGYAAVKKDNKWGAIDKEGKIVIEPTYNLENNLKIDFIGKWHLGFDLNMNYYCNE